MGSSNLTLGEAGCTTSASASGATYLGDTLTPKDLAKHKELYTKDGYVIWNMFTKIFKYTKFLWRYYQFDEKIADDALLKDPNKFIIFRVNKGSHWVLALKKGFNSYVCLNPYHFPARSQTYAFKGIDGMAVFCKK